MSHPIRPASVIEMNNFYTATVYNKGAEVIRMYHTLLGEAKFQQGMQLYIERHDGQAVTCDDFVAAMQDASGVDLTLFKRWYSESGTPDVAVSDHFDAQTNTYSLTFKQSNKATADQKVKQILHIPVDIELLDTTGQAIDLGNGQTTQVLSLIEAEQTFTFNNVSEKPVPCLFRSFSAPVKYTFNYTDEQLQHLISFASDDFSRWDAGQILFNKYLIANVKNIQEGKALTLPILFISGFKKVLTNAKADPALTAGMFEFISESGAHELFEQVDIEALHEARQFMLNELAMALKSEFEDAYRNNQVKGEYAPNIKDIACRQLANLSLSFIARADKVLANELVIAQINNANNMTNHISAVAVANMAQLDCRDSVMQDFDDKWFENGLVMDKWFALQATLNSESVLENIKELFDHRSFDFSNPNRVRALLGSFAVNNSYYFHAKDGSGYAFLTDQLIKLNDQNPQVAARLITSLIQFKRLDIERQNLVKTQLNRLLALDGLSLDLFEKVTKALAQ
jgi:aminopeptidase N